MTFPSIRLAAAVLLGAAAVVPAHAESFASSAASAGSASSGSVSDSLRASSNSSNRDRNNNLAGDYRVIRVAALPERAGMVRLTMQLTTAQADGEDVITLDLPQAALGERGMAAGDMVRANQRPYGYEFARGDTREAFFLALNDEWTRDLTSHPVVF